VTDGPAFIIAPDPKSRMWQLPRVQSGRFSLLSWRVAVEDSRHSVVPAEVANVIARALTRIAWVMFPTSMPPKPAPSDFVEVLTARGMVQRMKDWASRTPNRIFLVSTREPTSMQRLFDDGGFPWWMQGNVALLSDACAHPLRLDRRRLLAILDLDAIDRHVLAAQDMWGILVPGVDGAVAGIISRDDADQKRVASALEQEARAAGFGWLVATEDQFSDFLRQPSIGLTGGSVFATPEH
jgi:hypothetical protein